MCTGNQQRRTYTEALSVTCHWYSVFVWSTVRRDERARLNRTVNGLLHCHEDSASGHVDCISTRGRMEDGGEWTTSHSVRFTPPDCTGAEEVGGWVSPEGGLDVGFVGMESLSVQRLASPYGD